MVQILNVKQMHSSIKIFHERATTYTLLMVNCNNILLGKKINKSKVCMFVSKDV